MGTERGMLDWRAEEGRLDRLRENVMKSVRWQRRRREEDSWGKLHGPPKLGDGPSDKPDTGVAA